MVERVNNLLDENLSSSNTASNVNVKEGMSPEDKLLAKVTKLSQKIKLSGKKTTFSDMTDNLKRLEMV